MTYLQLHCSHHAFCCWWCVCLNCCSCTKQDVAGVGCANEETVLRLLSFCLPKLTVVVETAQQITKAGTDAWYTVQATMAPPVRAESPAKYWWQSLLHSNAAVLLLVAVCATATYVNTLDFGFTYDDKVRVERLPTRPTLHVETVHG